MDSLEIVGAIVGTGASSAAMTVVALRVHIQYLRESVARQERAIQRAHERIDEIQHELKIQKTPSH